MTRDYGTNVGLMATGLGIATGALLYSAHAAGMQAVHDRRQALADAAHADNLAAERANHQELADLARTLASQLAAERAANAKLRRALVQRQAFIDRMRRQ